MSDDLLLFERQLLAQLLEEPLGCARVSSLLQEDGQDLTVFIDSSPQSHDVALHDHAHFIQVPSCARCASTAFDLETDLHSEFVVPFAQGFVADRDAAFTKQFLPDS